MSSPKSNQAALYLRSSKDRSDVSIDAQRRELTALASQRGLVVVGEYTDVVESGADENRPGLQRLIADIRQRSRGWDTVLLLDTSRLARRPFINVMFERDAERHGVRVVYKSVPDEDPITAVVIKSFMMGIDQWHSLTSKRKGLAGMAENVRQGFRAGGRAPRGYRLVTIATGAIREGAQVTKSKLEPSADAPVVAQYLRLRAEGISRTAVQRQLKIPWPATSLIGMRLYERNDLKDFLATILDRVELDPEEATLQVCYRIPLRGGNFVASPRGFGTIPTIVARTLAKVA